MTSQLRLTVGTALLIPIAMANMGGGCTFPGLFPDPDPIVIDFVDVELSNEALDPVAPGLYVDGALFQELEDEPLAVGERGVQVRFDCFAGTTLQTDALLLTAAGAIASDNAPLLQEGIDFNCGDVISYFFVENGVDPFFTRVERNGVFLTDKPIR